MIRFISFLVCLVAHLQPVDVLAESNGVLRVWNFDYGILTDQGGYYNHFQAAGSEASVQLVRESFRGVDGRSMKVTYKKANQGFCGVWLHTFDETKPRDQRTYLEVAEYPFLSFWVKGEKGGEDFTIQMADPEWINREDSRPAGLVSTYLDGPLQTNWQEVVVPNKDFGLATSQAGGIIFNFTQVGQSAIYVDDIHFKKQPDEPVPVSVETRKMSTRTNALARAMWVWDIHSLLLKADYRADFFAFCNRQGINELFLQIPYRFINDLTEDVQCELQHADKMREFLAQARQRGILCHALDGYPEFSLRAHHPRVLAQIDAILAFNDASSPEERFHGIHLDNEPYQLSGFEGPERENILRQYLELNDKAIVRVRAHGSRVVYGVDIPFWFDEDTEDGAYQNRVTYKGVRKYAAEHIIDLCDNVGIMDYRNFAGGADGAIRHAQGEMKYAEKVGKKIYIGLETFKYEPTTVVFLYAMPESEWKILEDQPEGYLLSSTVDGFHVRTFKAGAIRLIGLAAQANRSEDPEFRNALHKLYARYGASIRQDAPDFAQMGSKIQSAIVKDGRYSGFEPFAWKDDNGAILAAGFKTTELMLEKITFAGMTKRQLDDAIREIADAFWDQKSFHGFAIHYYDTYRGMPDQ